MSASPSVPDHQARFVSKVNRARRIVGFWVTAAADKGNWAVRERACVAAARSSFAVQETAPQPRARMRAEGLRRGSGGKVVVVPPLALVQAFMSMMKALGGSTRR